MKIAYITLHWPRTKNSSIGKKIMRQVKAWRSFGHTVQFFSHLHTIENPENLIDGEKFIYPSDQGLIKREIGRIAAAIRLIKSVKDFAPDLIYLRWGMYTIPMRKVFSLAPVVLEINTNDKVEHHLLGLILDIYNRATRSIFLRKAEGVIFTSQELANDPAFTHFIREFRVIANGIDISEIPFYPAPANTPPRLIFLGTPGMAWHGLEKLVQLANILPDIVIDVIGSEGVAIGKSQLPRNINFYGYLSGQAFEQKLAAADAAIGTVSLHIKKMEEASPLKIRDCAGRGIPCILPYTDTDLSGLDCDEILQIPNTPDNLERCNQDIRDFLYAMRGKRLAREIITEKIDLMDKEKARVAFFGQILAKED